MAYRNNQGQFVSKAEWLTLNPFNQADEHFPDINQMMSNQKPQAITGMVQRINSAMNDRERFEYSESPFSSHIWLRKAAVYVRNNRTLASFLLALNVDPDVMLNRSRKEGWRSNLKGIQHVKMLLDYITGKSAKFDRVCLALFASSIVAANRGVGFVTNAEQELILMALPIRSLPKDVQDAIAEYRHRFTRSAGDVRPASSRFRCTFDNLGCYTASQEDQDDANRKGIMINMASPVIDYLNKRWNLDSVN